MKEQDIRKRDVFNKYISMVKEDIKKLFEVSSFINVVCPACSGTKHKPAFSKTGFKYVNCKSCGTLFVNPRPSNEDLHKFYSNSDSTSFWVNEFFAPVAEARREKIFKPRAEFIKNYFSDMPGSVIGDIGAGFGIFLEELRKIWPEGQYIAIEPSLEQADICREKNLIVENCMLEQLKGFDEHFDILVAFELFEHVFDPAKFLKNIWKKLNPGGYFLMTTLSGEGFDIATLWENSKSVSPPHHLNFFNTDSIRLLFKNSGFEVVDIATPGELDWDIVEGMYREENIDIPRFWKTFADKGTKDAKREFQGWLTKHKMSSHMRVIGKKQEALL